MFLPDTNVLSEPRKINPNLGLLSWLKRADEDRLFLSSVSITEIRLGLALMNDGHKKRQLIIWLEQDLMIRFAKRIIVIDKEVALVWRDVMALISTSQTQRTNISFIRRRFLYQTNL